jgi:glycosyltransferase involved in cell wall biosynthesis
VTRSPRRIFFARLADAANFNAQAKNAQYILRYWSSERYRPTVLTYGEPDAVVATNRNVDVVQLRKGRAWLFDFFAAYMRDFDAIFCPGLHPVVDWLALNLRARMPRRPVVVSTSEGLLGEFASNTYEERYTAVAGHEVFCQKIDGRHLKRMKYLQRNANHIVAISPFLEKQAIAEFGPKVSMLPLGVDVDLFAGRDEQRAERPTVVCAASFQPGKRPEIFFELAKAFPAADFIWYGEGEARATLVSRAAEMKLGNLKFPGGLGPAALADAFARAHILVLPSKAEGVPKVTQDAAAAGLAQIVFGFYEAPTVVDGKNGFVVWNDRDLMGRLGQLLVDPALVRAMGRAGSDMAKDWSWNVISPLWEDRIVGILEGAHCANASKLVT